MMSTKQIMMKNKKDAVVLLSGGLDCSSALAMTVNEYDYSLAMTFDYGQKAFEKEFIASSRIAKFYNIEHRVIKLDWLKEITKTFLVSEGEIPQNVDIKQKEITEQSAKSVWVPNRNSVFINIAAAFLDSQQGGLVVIGANREEAQTFSDNSKDFVEKTNKMLELSCLNSVEVAAPLIDLDKTQIVALAVKNGLPFEYINSCYSSNNGHCGVCESCLRLKEALKNNGQYNIIKKLF